MKKSADSPILKRDRKSESPKRGGIHLKDKVAEERAILDIAQTLKVFAF